MTIETLSGAVYSGESEEIVAQMRHAARTESTGIRHYMCQFRRRARVSKPKARIRVWTTAQFLDDAVREGFLRRKES